jgi:alkylated DNA repair dioxygenase AlkB
MNQLDIFGQPSNADQPIQIDRGSYIYIPNFFNHLKANSFLNTFINDIEWNQEGMMMYGKYVLFPRLTAWYGENDKPYSFSGITLQPKSWNKELLEIKKLIEPIAETSFNSVLLNRYRDGSDSISWHTDAEKELGKNPIIASVNFGAERVFQLKNMKTQERIDILLKHGSLLVMMGELQHNWQHQVPKTKKVIEERVNLTFRNIK